MIEFTHVVKDPLGIYEQPASRLAKEASRYNAAVTMIKGSKVANVKGSLDVMSLIVKTGDTVTVTVSGDDEQEAAHRLRHCMNEYI